MIINPIHQSQKLAATWLILGLFAVGASAQDALKLPIPRPAGNQTAPRLPAQTLPGVGVLPGDAQQSKVNSIRVGSDRNEIVYVSLTQINRLATPFESPQVIDASGASVKTVGQDIYFRPSSDAPVTIYVSNGANQTLGITLVPRANLPAQTIVMQPDTPAGSVRQSQSSGAAATSDEVLPSDYVGRLNVIIRSVALGQTPQGFTKSRLPASAASTSDLTVFPDYKLSGSNYDVYAYRVKSTTAIPIELKEEGFFSDGVRAIAFYPNVVLQQGDETAVFVVADRSENGGEK